MEILEAKMKPKRIQRKRAKGWRMPENTIYVGKRQQTYTKQEYDKLQAELETEATEHLRIQQNTELVFVTRIEQLQAELDTLRAICFRESEMLKRSTVGNNPLVETIAMTLAEEGKKAKE